MSSSYQQIEPRNWTLLNLKSHLRIHKIQDANSSLLIFESGSWKLCWKWQKKMQILVLHFKCATNQWNSLICSTTELHIVVTFFNVDYESHWGNLTPIFLHSPNFSHTLVGRTAFKRLRAVGRRREGEEAAAPQHFRPLCTRPSVLPCFIHSFFLLLLLLLCTPAAAERKPRYTAMKAEGRCCCAAPFTVTIQTVLPEKAIVI